MFDNLFFAGDQYLGLLILFILVGVSLLLNGAVIWYGLRYREQIRELRRTVRKMLHEAMVDLKGLEELSLHLDVQVRDSLPVATDIPLEEEMTVRVRGEIPVQQTLTTPVTVKASGIKVPVQVTIPLDFVVPIDMEMPVSIEHQVPVRTVVPIELDLPLDIDLSETELGAFAEEVRRKLDRLSALLADSRSRPPVNGAGGGVGGGK